MIPHRPWPLFVLSLALWTGASSAQTWTTVWTLDSAPPPTHTKMEQEMEPEKDHKSPTNCYPCKEWEAYGDGTGKWVHYPEGTEPIQCDGDETDYACKECDDKGEVRNKENGTDCSTSSINAGCCKDGVCTTGRPLTDWADLQACPKLITRPDYTPGHTTPACSVPDNLQPIVGNDPDHPGGFDFTDCCIEHDVNYRTCQMPKNECDDVLEACLGDVCNAAPWWDRMNCRFYADAYVLGVRLGGGDAYHDAQVEGCYCCD